MTSHFKIEATCTFYKAINNLYLLKTSRIIKGRPLVPLANHTMLAHQWRKSSACWCKHPKTFMAIGKNVFVECQL